jgi:hypothetical protein
MTFACIYSKCFTFIELVRYCTKIPKNIPKYGFLVDYITTRQVLVFSICVVTSKECLPGILGCIQYLSKLWITKIGWQEFDWVQASKHFNPYFCWKLVHCWQANNADHTKSSSPLGMSINYPFQAIDFAGKFFCLHQAE